CQRPGDRVYCALGRIINHPRRWSERAGERTDVDDAAASRAEMLQGFLRRQHHAEDVGIKLAMKFFFRYLFESCELVNAGVIDQDVDLSERFLRSRKKSLDVGFLRNTRLDCDGFSTALRDILDDFVR